MAARTPSHCFEAAIEAVPHRRQVPHAGASCSPTATWPTGPSRGGCPTLEDLPDHRARASPPEPNHIEEDGTEVFWPYLRDDETLARPWAPPGLPGLEHRIGGLEKADGSGNVSYDGANHERMTQLRAAKVAGIADDIPPTEVDDEDGAAGAGASGGVRPTGPSPPACSGSGPGAIKVAHAHLVHLNPFPADLGDVLQPLQAGAGARGQPRAS